MAISPYQLVHTNKVPISTLATKYFTFLGAILFPVLRPDLLLSFMTLTINPIKVVFADKLPPWLSTIGVIYPFELIQ